MSSKKSTTSGSGKDKKKEKDDDKKKDKRKSTFSIKKKDKEDKKSKTSRKKDESKSEESEKVTKKDKKNDKSKDVSEDSDDGKKKKDTKKVKEDKKHDKKDDKKTHDKKDDKKEEKTKKAPKKSESGESSEESDKKTKNTKKSENSDESEESEDGKKKKDTKKAPKDDKKTEKSKDVSEESDDGKKKKDTKKVKEDKKEDKKKDDKKKAKKVKHPVTEAEIRAYYKTIIGKSTDGSISKEDFDQMIAFAAQLTPEQREHWSKIVLEHESHNHYTNKKSSPVNFSVNIIDNPEAHNDGEDDSDNGGTMEDNGEIKETKDKDIWKTLKKGARKEWSNQTKVQVVQPLYIYKPSTLFGKDESSLEFILRHALLNECKVKPFGSGHSYSDCATTTDFLVDTHGMKKVCSKKRDIEGQLTPDVLKEGSLPFGEKELDFDDYNPEKNRALLELECGVRLIDLNKVLDDRKLGLMNMGGYDHQTIMGVISTSTHGSGINIGPFCDMVKSLVIATTGTWDGKNLDKNGSEVYFYRIEPSDGITDPAKYKNDRIPLIQNDDCFYAVACNIGTFGIVYSVVIEVMQQYWLREDRESYTLDQVVELLKPNPNNEGHVPDLLKDYRNCEILVHPYPMTGDKEVHEFTPKDVEKIYPEIKCLITKRNICPKPKSLLHPGKKGHRDCISGFVQQFNLTFEATVALLNTNPLLIPWAINTSLETLHDKDYENVSHEIYVLGLNGNAGFACEIGYPIEDSESNYSDAYIKRILNRILVVAQKSRLNGFQFQTSPFSLRFVKKSPCHMSMMYGRTTMMIEFDMLTGTLGGYEVMKRTESEMYDLGGRPHWGLDYDWVNGNIGLQRLYPKYPLWKTFYDNFNARGTFNNSFTNRMGLWNYDVLPVEKIEE